MITKTKDISKVTAYENNLVSSTYEMLWGEVRDTYLNPISCYSTTLANTIRRIIEHYFKFLGEMDLNRFHLLFPDGERQVFKLLITWANVGSHSEFDDFSAALNLYMVENYLKVFKDLFKKTNHMSHYNMMIKLEVEGTEDE